MLCEKCKIREANIKYTEVINGVRNEHNLCAQCAKEMDLGYYSAIFDGEFPLGKLLSSLLGVGETSQKEDKLQQIMCPACKTSYGKKPRYQKILAAPSVTGSGQEEIQEPKLSREEKLQVLKARLQEAVLKEEYELAAQYRDQIRDLEQMEEQDA